MASNRIPQNLEALVSLAEDSADGAHLHEASIPIGLNKEAAIRKDIYALTGDPDPDKKIEGALPAYNRLKAERTAATEALRAAEQAAREKAAGCVDLLRTLLGRSWSAKWSAAGFTGNSLSIPSDPLSLLGELRAYFVKNPDKEYAPSQLSAAGCLAASDGLSDARSALNQATALETEGKQKRDDMRDALYKRMSGLRSELGQQLKGEDSRWYAFGFDRPVDGEQPGPVTQVKVVAGGVGIVIVSWKAARRAERYRASWKSTAPGAVETVVSSTIYDRTCTLQGLPTGADIVVTVSGINSTGVGHGGESPVIKVP